MNKEEFVKLLKEIGVYFVEGEQNDIKKSDVYPRLLMFEIVWDFDIASSDVYDMYTTYQLSFFSKMPRDPKLINLVKMLIENKMLTSQVQHEYVTDKGGYFHSYFSIQLKDSLL